MRTRAQGNPGRRLRLAPPEAFVTAARVAMGGIDFDPWTSNTYNRLTLARRYIDYDLIDLETACRDDWDIPAEGRVICAAPPSMTQTRMLLGRLLKEYRRNAITTACILVSASEIMIKAPWIWDFPIAFPFGRQAFRWYDEEFSRFRSLTPALWSFVLFFPRCDTVDQYQQSLARFYDAFAPSSRIVFNEFAGDDSWKQHYKTFYGRDFNELR